MASSSAGQAGGFGRWLVRGLSRLMLLLVVFAAGALVMHFGMHAGEHETVRAQDARIESLQTALAGAQAELAAQRSAAEVQAGTQRVLQDKNAELQQQLGQTRDQLAFYEQLIPPAPAGAVAVRAFDIQPEGDFLRYRVLLTRNTAPQSESFNGRMRFVANGHAQGKAVKIELSPPVAPAAGETAASVSGSDPLALVFDQFQRSTGVLQRPPGLTLESVRLEILEGDTVRASQDAELNRVVSDPAGVLP
jgi:hypothetical protein